MPGFSLSTAWAANVTKLDTPSLAATAANWSAAPAATDVGEFNGAASAASLAGLTLGGVDLTLGGLLFDGAMQGPATVAAGNNLTLGTAGIDMLAANQNVTLGCAVSLGGAQNWNVVSPQTLTVNGVVAMTNVLTINGTGAVTLGGANTGAGGLTISNGFVTFGNAVAAGTGTLALGGGTVVINGLTITNAVNVTGVAVITNGGSAATFSGNFSGAGTMNLIESTNNTLTFDTAGQLSAFAGTVKASDAMPAAYLRMYGCTGSTAATFDLGNGSVILHTRNGNAVSLGALKGGVDTTVEGARSTTAANTAYGIGANNASTTFYGTITNGTVAGATVSLTKVGTGTLTLAGTNNAGASGPTEVSAGTLQIGDGTADGSLLSSNVIIDAAGTLAFDRSDNYTITNSIANAGALTIFGGGTNTYNIGAYSGAGAINVNSGRFVLASPAAALGPVYVGPGATFERGARRQPGIGPIVVRIGRGQYIWRFVERGDSDGQRQSRRKRRGWDPGRQRRIDRKRRCQQSICAVHRRRHQRPAHRQRQPHRERIEYDHLDRLWQRIGFRRHLSVDHLQRRIDPVHRGPHEQFPSGGVRQHHVDQHHQRHSKSNRGHGRPARAPVAESDLGG